MGPTWTDGCLGSNERNSDDHCRGCKRLTCIALLSITEGAHDKRNDTVLFNAFYFARFCFNVLIDRNRHIFILCCRPTLIKNGGLRKIQLFCTKGKVSALDRCQYTWGEMPDFVHSTSEENRVSLDKTNNAFNWRCTGVKLQTQYNCRPADGKGYKQ